MTQLEEVDIRHLTENIWRVVLEMEVRPIEIDMLGEISELLTGRIALSGEWNGSVVVQCTKKAAAMAAETMFGIDEADVQHSDMRDALCEITNMTGGSVKALLPGTNDLSLPEFVFGVDQSAPLPGSVVETERAFRCDGEPLLVRVFRNAGDD